MTGQKKAPGAAYEYNRVRKEFSKPTEDGFTNNIQHVKVDFNRVFDVLKEYEYKVGGAKLQTDGLVVKVNIIDPFSEGDKRYSFIDFPQTDFMERVCAFYKYAGYVTDHGLTKAVAKMKEIIEKAEEMEEKDYAIRDFHQ